MTATDPASAHLDLVRLLAATRAVLRLREEELRDLKGPCRRTPCTLHCAHRGPCNAPEAESAGPMVFDSQAAAIRAMVKANEVAILRDSRTP